MKKIVCFGGGNAMPKVILSELKKYHFDICSVTSMTDSGGSTGIISKEYGILPVGDIRRHLLSFSNKNQEQKDLFNFRFQEGFLKGHNFGNIFILNEYLRNNKNFLRAIEKTSRFLEIQKNCKCLPVILERTNLYAELESGGIIKGEDEIDIPKNHNGKLKIKKIFLKPKVKTFVGISKEIKQANFIILGPGDLYSSILPCFLSSGILASIKKTKAKIIFICPAMTKFGETNNFSILDFTKEVEFYLNKKIDSVLFNNKFIDSKRLKEYKKQKNQFLHQVRVNKNLDSNKFIGKSLLLSRGAVEYDPPKTIKEILKLMV